MSTSPVSYCWAMAATSPLASRFSRAAICGSSPDWLGAILMPPCPRRPCGGGGGAGARGGGGADPVAGPGQGVLDLADGSGAEVKQAGGQDGVGAGRHRGGEVGHP